MNVHSLDMNQRTPLFRLESFDASAEDFARVLEVYASAGGDFDHMDHQGNSMLMWTSNDALGVALVCAGASTYYFRKSFRKRALAMAAVHGCLKTMEAIVARDSPDNDFVTRSFHAAALQISYDSEVQDMSGIYKLACDYGAGVNRCGTLARCVDRNPFVISALVSLGADRSMLVWDWQRGLKNTAVHRVAETQALDVYQALVFNLAPEELGVGDEFGRTSLMTLLSEDVASEEYLRQRFDWLVESGASCLPFNDNGKRVSNTLWGQRRPFSDLIAARVREENWLKRRGFLFLRKRGVSADDGGEDDCLVLQVAFLAEFGVFKNIVGFL